MICALCCAVRVFAEKSIEFVVFARIKIGNAINGKYYNAIWTAVTQSFLIKLRAVLNVDLGGNVAFAIGASQKSKET